MSNRKAPGKQKSGPRFEGSILVVNSEIVGVQLSLEAPLFCRCRALRVPPLVQLRLIASLRRIKFAAFFSHALANAPVKFIVAHCGGPKRTPTSAIST